MSGFVSILDRSGAPVDEGVLERLARPLACYGGRVESFCRGPVGIAVRHRGGAHGPEAHRPLTDPERMRVLAVAGRIHRMDGPSPVSCDGDVGEPADAVARSLVRSAGAQDDLLSRLAGPFSLVEGDLQACAMTVTRDHLGAVSLYYSLDARWLIAATEPSAILRHGTVSDDPDEGSIARFLGFRFGETGRSFFRQIRELPPAHRLRVTADEAHLEQYWRFRRRSWPVRRSPGEISGEFIERLARSVAADVPGPGPERVAISLSGGLDSTALAALAPRGVRAFSWTFDDLSEADERSRIEAVSRHLDLPVHWVRGDGLYPLCDGFEERFVHENSPYVNAFAALKCRLYRQARAAGCERVIVGDGGDAPYAAQEYWLRDALTAGGGGAVRSLAGTLRRAARGDRFARLALVRLLPVRGLRTVLRGGPSPWLTPAARAAQPAVSPSPVLPSGPRRTRHEIAVGAKHTELESEERRLFAQCGVERANPFWSWPVLEMAVQLPATWYHRDGRSKVLVREALRGRLPKEVLEGGRRGLLGAFFLRGIERRREDLRETLFRRPLSDWQRYVRRDWLEPHLEGAREIAFGHTILWRVISYELWTRRRIRGS